MSLSPSVKPAPLITFRSLQPYLVAALGWGILGSLLVIAFSGGVAGSVFVGAWAACLLELGSLTKLAESVFQLIKAPVENRPQLRIRTSYWVIIKLASWGIFALILTQGHRIPAGATSAMLAGFGTLAAVPLLGGGLSGWIESLT